MSGGGLDLAALRATAEAADAESPGPWRATIGLQVRGGRGTVACWDCCGGNPHLFEATQQHIAAANPKAVLALLDEIAALRANLRIEADSHEAAVARARRWRKRCDEERYRIAEVEQALTDFENESQGGLRFPNNIPVAEVREALNHPTAPSPAAPLDDETGERGGL